MIHVTLFQGTAGKTKYGFVVEPNRKSDCMGFIRAKCGVGIGIKVRWLKKSLSRAFAIQAVTRT